MLLLVFLQLTIFLGGELEDVKNQKYKIRIYENLLDGSEHFALIKVIDQMRMLDQDLIRLQQKVDVVLEYRARQQVINEAKENDKE